VSMDDAFLRFLDQMDEEQKLLRSQNARVIEHQLSTDALSLAPMLIDEDNHAISKSEPI
jgi:hypothetical protein